MKHILLGGVFLKTLFLQAVIFRTDFKSREFKTRVVCGNSATPAPKMCVEDSLSWSCILPEYPVVQRHRLLSRVDSLFIQSFVALHDIAFGDAFPCIIPFHMNLNSRTDENRFVAAISQSEKLVLALHLSQTIRPGANW